MIVYDNGETTVSVEDNLVCISEGGWLVALTFNELADIADAVEQHLSAAEIPCPDSGEWDPLGQGGGG